MWLVGGAAVGLSLLAIMSKQSGSSYRPNRRRQRSRRVRRRAPRAASDSSKVRRAIHELALLRKEDRQTLKHLRADMKRFAHLERSLKSVL
jgi:hypothetical protein